MVSLDIAEVPFSLSISQVFFKCVLCMCCAVAPVVPFNGNSN